MYNVLFCVICIKRDRGEKAQHSSIRTYTHIHLKICIERQRRRQRI